MLRKRPRILAVCVGVASEHRRAGGTIERSAIDKRSIVGPVPVHPLGIDGDTQVETRFHGGVDRAVYAYSQADADHWATALRRDVPPGLLGENLRVEGLEVSQARIGERWHTSRGVVLEVTAPRMPCWKLQRFLEVPDMVERFLSAGRPGAYLRVLTPGGIAAGDRLTVTRPPGGDEVPTVADVMVWRKLGATAEQLSTLAALDTLAEDLRSWAVSALSER